MVNNKGRLGLGLAAVVGLAGILGVRGYNEYQNNAGLKADSRQTLEQAMEASREQWEMNNVNAPYPQFRSQQGITDTNSRMHDIYWAGTLDTQPQSLEAYAQGTRGAVPDVVAITPEKYFSELQKIGITKDNYLASLAAGKVLQEFVQIYVTRETAEALKHDTARQEVFHRLINPIYTFTAAKDDNEDKMIGGRADYHKLLR